MFNKAQAPSQPKTYNVPVELNVALLHTIIAVTALRDVLTKETDALKHTNTKAFLELQEEKVEVARRYETLVNNLMARPAEEIKTADQKLKDQLLRLQADFGQIAKTNRESIDRMKNATERLGEHIIRSARKAADTERQFAYGASGKMQQSSKTTIGVEERA